jgi:large subunit ribosomal protein L19e
MMYKTRKRIAASILKCSPKRVRFEPKELESIKEALTKEDMRGLIHDGIISKKQKKGISRARAKVRQKKRTKGQRSGAGKRKGTTGSRLPKKTRWMKLIRSQREFIRELRDNENINGETYREMYLKTKGGFFRSKRHIKIYLNERKLIK